jgi:hypothetical protein
MRDYPPLYGASTHETAGTTPANMVLGRELHLPCDLLFGARLDNEQSTTDYVLDLVDRQKNIHHSARQHLKVASDRPAMTTTWPTLWDSRNGQSLAPPSDPDQRKVTKAPAIMGSTMQGDDPDQRRDLPDSATSQGEDNGAAPRQNGTIPRGYSGRVT